MIPVPSINRAVIQAVNVGRSIADDVRAVFITDEPADIGRMQASWEKHLPGVPLVVVESPYGRWSGRSRPTSTSSTRRGRRTRRRRSRS